MQNETPREFTLSDPLNLVTRKERKLLLVSSILGITVVKTGFIPTKISALGIDFAKTDQNSLLLVLGSIILYFLIAFVIYGTSDFLMWRLTYSRVLQDAMLDKLEKEVRKTPIIEMSGYIAKYIEGGLISRILLFLVQIVPWLRAIFEFLLPILLGLYAIISIIYEIK